MDYACGQEEYPAGVIAPREVADYSDSMSRNCEFKQHEVDAITHWQGLPETHGDGTLYKISEMDPTYYEEKREDQMNRLLFLDRLLRFYPKRKIPDYNYEAIQEAKEMRDREEEKAAAVEAETREVKIIKITEIKEYPPCCDVIRVK